MVFWWYRAVSPELCKQELEKVIGNMGEKILIPDFLIHMFLVVAVVV